MFQHHLEKLKALTRFVLRKIRSFWTNEARFGLVPLVVDGPPGEESPGFIPIRSARFLIGREAHCPLQIEDPFLSGQHCVILTEGNEIFVEDLQSTNGTFVNFERIYERQKLRDGDYLEMGCRCFVVSLKEREPAPAAQSEWLKERSCVEATA